MNTVVSRGKSFPIGVTVYPSGVNFSVFAQGNTAVELLLFDQADDSYPARTITLDPVTNRSRHYWHVSVPGIEVGQIYGYDPLATVDEFRNMVKALHRAGIEVILDVVYNHTAEGGANGPTLCFKGFANQCYYILDRDTGSYANYSGTGNTLNANEPFVRRLIRDSLHYWVDVMHVDGFRFDLASILSRDESGRPLENPPVLWDVDSDPGLADTKLIAEAWDAAGLYQVGSFIGDSWKEWNGRFRDDVRSFMKADNGTVARIPYRLFGSPDIYGHAEREPEQSINFVTCNDGFTLNDLVSYNAKQNGGNGENNRDGADAYLSWNCGIDTLNQLLERARFECHGVKLYQPNWSNRSHSLAISASPVAADLDLYLMLNAYWEPLRFELPPIPEPGLRPWRCWLDTFLEPPADICLFSDAPPVAGTSYLVYPRSIVALARVAD